jgi:hypothetical protein
MCSLCSHASVIACVSVCFGTALSVLIGSISPLMWGLQKRVRSVLLSRLCMFGCSSSVFPTERLANISVYAGGSFVRT